MSKKHDAPYLRGSLLEIDYFLLLENFSQVYSVCSQPPKASFLPVPKALLVPNLQAKKYLENILIEEGVQINHLLQLFKEGYQFLKMAKKGEGRDCVIVRIESKVYNLPSFTQPKPIIDYVYHSLKQMNEKDFEPQMVSIGPIHHGKDHVKAMEQHKVRYLRQLLQRRRDIESSIEKIVSKLRSMEGKARLCYPKSINLDQDEFVEMMLLDGCFVIELIRIYFFDYPRDEGDEIFQSDQMLSQIRHDLMLLENQLPFFVLSEMFDMTKTEDPEDELVHLLLFLFQGMIPWSDFSRLDSSSFKLYMNADHVLGLVYQSCFSPSAKYLFTENTCQNQMKMVHTSSSSSSSASEIKKSGIRLKSSKGMNLWDVSFVNGVVKLPPLNISDETESLLKNLIAYELCFPHDHPKYVTDYTFLLHSLIRSTKDVGILRRNGIISNFIGSDDMICLMFNRLGNNVVISSDFSYSNVVESLNRYSRKGRRKWKAKVKRKHFKGPWGMITFLGAALLLILTFIQTLLFMLSYRKLFLSSTVY